MPGFASHSCGLTMVPWPSVPANISHSTGPHQSSIRFFTSTEQGAAPWITKRRLETS